MSDPKLSVLVRVDLDGRHLRLIVTGCLSAANQQALHPVIERARTLTPAAEVLVDLTAGDPPEPAAVTLLRAGIDQQCRDRPGGRVQLVLPEPGATTDQRPRAGGVLLSGTDRAARAGWDTR
ncbi:hypothetical protein RF644_07730 [Kocuria sp. CPCC 205258]|uniref:hypothetical protein n=1 Tax=Kocuria sp. CPCC 205258 TaxID=3073552 RepID=UPI0034D55088